MYSALDTLGTPVVQRRHHHDARARRRDCHRSRTHIHLEGKQDQDFNSMEQRTVATIFTATDLGLSLTPTVV